MEEGHTHEIWTTESHRQVNTLRDTELKGNKISPDGDFAEIEGKTFVQYRFVTVTVIVDAKL